MRIMIEIPDELYNTVQEFKNAIILPKGHGRLVDVDEIINRLNSKEVSDYFSEVGSAEIEDFLDTAPTIIEADKGDDQMQIKRLELSESEAAVMRCVWNRGGISCPKEIQSDLKENSINYAITTVYTTLQHLADKGFLKKEKKSNKDIRFISIKSNDRYLEDFMQKACDDWFGGDWSNMADWLTDKVV